MTELFQHIIDQLKHNSGKNIFCKTNISRLEFIESTKDIISKYKLSEIDESSDQELIEFTVKNVLDQFYQTNQYYYFDIQSISELKNIYRDLFSEIKKVTPNAISENLSLISDIHYKKLQEWIKKSNSFAEKIYSDQLANLKQYIVCSEYSAQTQISLLGIDLEDILEPIVDVGCGKEANLVHYLNDLGYSTHGIDRSVENTSILSNSNWFEFDFKPYNWGTIISNLGFSNHFNHHHLRNDGLYLDYAKKYIEILNSLKIGGSFYYAPNLAFIEKFHDIEMFKIEYKLIENTNFKVVQIKRLK